MEKDLASPTLDSEPSQLSAMPATEQEPEQNPDLEPEPTTKVFAKLESPLVPSSFKVVKSLLDNPSAPPVVPSSCTDMPSQSSALPWPVDPSNPPQASLPQTPPRPSDPLAPSWLNHGVVSSIFAQPWLHLGSTLAVTIDCHPSGSARLPHPSDSTLDFRVSSMDSSMDPTAFTTVMPACSSTVALQALGIALALWLLLGLNLSRSSPWFCSAFPPRLHHGPSHLHLLPGQINMAGGMLIDR
ncbi:hypothetical protein DPX16_8257 [Anabarilius grahami]|uniref:Uncharacterized protein n=1 Tax=Anabarilius grahami TaxID=495550 RepID=A0A3N0Y9L5_ANAGA|nr:hypothetical protein DPX16_8257 [Anabarilius grahami]